MSSIIQCAECQMYSHKNSSNCGFCGKNLFGDKTRALLSKLIPPTAFIMISLFILNLLITLPLQIQKLVILFDEFLILLIIFDLLMDHRLHKLRMKSFVIKRAKDIIFLISALGFLKLLRISKFGMEVEKYAIELSKFAHTTEKGLLSAENASIMARFRHDVVCSMPLVRKIGARL